MFSHLILLARHINVNCVAPGPFRTKMMSATLDKQDIALPIPRIGDASDVAGVVLFLSSRASSFITGALIPVDGGYLVSKV